MMSEGAKKAARQVVLVIDAAVVDFPSLESTTDAYDLALPIIQAAIDEAVKSQRQHSELFEESALFYKGQARALAKALKPLTQWPQTGEDRDAGIAILADYARATGETL